jgi:tetratricopeptide (TPR) repeat protein
MVRARFSRIPEFLALALTSWLAPSPLPFPAAFGQTAAQPPAESQIDRILEDGTRQLSHSAASASLLGTQALEAARKAGDSAGEIRSMLFLGRCSTYLGEDTRSEELFRQAQRLARAKGLTALAAESGFRLSRLLLNTNRYEEAVAGYVDAGRLADSLHDRVLGAMIDDHLGIANFVLKNRPQAVALCERARKVLESSGASEAEADNLEHLGIIWTGDKDWKKALDYFEKTRELRERIGDSYALAGTLGNIGLTLNSLNRKDEALAVLSRALKLVDELGDTRSAPTLHNRIGRVLQDLGQYDEAHSRFEEALKLSRQYGDKRAIASHLLAFGQFHRQIAKDPGAAYDYLEEYSRLIREVYDEDTAARIAAVQARFEADQKNREIEVLQRDRAIQELELKRRTLARNAAVTVALLLVISGGLVLYRYRVEARTSRRLRDALQNVRTLQGLLPICANCKRIRDDAGYWHQVEHYVSRYSQAEFTHGICPSCAQLLYPELTRQSSQEQRETMDVEKPSSL